MVFGLRLPFSENKDVAKHSLGGFTHNYINSIPDINQDIKIEQKDNYIMFEQTATSAESDTTYFYHTYIYKLSDAFMIVIYATPAENRAELDATIDDWVNSIKFE